MREELQYSTYGVYGEVVSVVVHLEIESIILCKYINWSKVNWQIFTGNTNYQSTKVCRKCHAYDYHRSPCPIRNAYKNPHMSEQCISQMS